MALELGNLYKIKMRFRAYDLSRGMSDQSRSASYPMRLNPGYYYVLLERVFFKDIYHFKMVRYKFLSAKSGTMYSVEIPATSRYYFEKSKFYNDNNNSDDAK